MISAARRTTIVVGDMEKSLIFYRDTLGMNVFYDQVIQAEAAGKLLGVPGARVRIVSLQSDDSLTGMVGLLSFLSPRVKPRQEIQSRISGPDVLLLFMADDIDVEATYKRINQAGFPVVCPPAQYNVPERGAISGLNSLDPDGITAAIMRFGTLNQEGGRVKASPIRRTTILVGDLKRSTSFYQEVLGMKVFYDQVIHSEEEGKMLGLPGAKVRIVSLQAGDSVEGMVGLMSVLSSDHKPRQEIQKLISNVDVALIFVTEEIEAMHEKMKQWGARVQHPPIVYEIPGRGVCAGLTCYDPDGILIEYTQFGPLKKF
jgi:catechol 2,3-dioxygenase-like lactoylglutathione lyase family enzyme